MTKIKIGSREFKIQFGFEPTLKERVISKVIKYGEITGDDQKVDLSKMEDFILYLPEFLLVGLQVYHKKEYGYNYDTKEGKENQLSKIFTLMDDYVAEGGNLMDLYTKLQEEMESNSFLSQMFEKEKKASNPTT